MSCTFKYCCCCLNLRYGSILIGIYYSLSYLVLASYALTITNSTVVVGGVDIGTFSFVKGIIICSISGFIVSVCLIYGAIEEKAFLIAPWLAVNSFMPIAALGGIIWGTILMGKYSDTKDPFIVLFVSLGALCLLIYCIIVVHSYRQELKSRNTQDNESDYYFTIPKRANIARLKWSKYLQSEAMKNAYI